MNRISPPRRKIAGIGKSLHGFEFCWLILFLAGCAVGPGYRRPTVNAPSAFSSDSVISTNSFADLPWWKVFHDEALQDLIRTALTNNYDVRIAVARIEQARAIT